MKQADSKLREYLKKYQDMSCVYRIDIGTKYYYGSTNNVYTRYKNYISQLNRNVHENTIMQNAFNKYQNFHITVVLYGEWSNEELRLEEQKYLDLMFKQPLDRNMNICMDAVRSRTGLKNSEENNRKHSKRMKGVFAGEKNPMYGSIAPTAKPVMIITPNGHSIRFDSAKERAKFLGLNKKTFQSWVCGEKAFPGKQLIKTKWGTFPRKSNYPHLVGLYAYYIEDQE